jgi:hypothetical protein
MLLLNLGQFTLPFNSPLTCRNVSTVSLSLSLSLYLEISKRKMGLLVDHPVQGDVIIKILWGYLADTSIPTLMYGIMLCYLY